MFAVVAVVGLAALGAVLGDDDTVGYLPAPADVAGPVTHASSEQRAWARLATNE